MAVLHCLRLSKSHVKFTAQHQNNIDQEALPTVSCILKAQRLTPKGRSKIFPKSPKQLSPIQKFIKENRHYLMVNMTV